MASLKNLFNFGKKSVITVDSLNETTREGINKAYIPKFLYKPPFGYPRFANMTYIRYLAQTPYVEMCIRTIIDEIAAIEWDIVPTDGMEEEADEAEIEHIRNFFNNPNTNKESFEEVFVRMPVRDVLEVNSGILNKVFNMKEEMVEIVARDGATFTKNPDIHGMYTDRDDIIMPTRIVDDNVGQEYFNPYTEITRKNARERAGYFQYGWIAGPIPVPFGKREIIWIEAMKRTDDHYGFSPVQVLAKSIQMLLYMIESDLEYYNDNNVPKGIIGLDESDADEIKAFKDQWFETQRTKDEFGSWKKIMNKVPIVNKVPTFTRIEFSASEMQVIEKQKWYSKMVWASFGVTPTELGYTEDAKGSANQIVQSKVFRKKAINPMLRNLESDYNSSIVSEFNYWGEIKTEAGKTIRRPKYEFKFKKFDVDEEASKYELYKLQVETGVRTINEIRKDEGLEPLAWGDDQPGAMDFGEENNGFDDENEDGEYIDDEAEPDEQEEVDEKPKNPKDTKSLRGPPEKPTPDPDAESDADSDDPDSEADGNKKKKTKAFKKAIQLKFKYIKKTGSTGNYKYWYRNPKTGKLVSGDKPKEDSHKSNIDKITDLISKKKYSRLRIEVDQGSTGRGHASKPSIHKITVSAEIRDKPYGKHKPAKGNFMNESSVVDKVESWLDKRYEQYLESEAAINPEALDFEDVKAPQKESDVPKNPGKISGGREFNDAVSYLISNDSTDSGKVMKLDVNISEINAPSMFARDISKQKKEIQQGIRHPIVVSYDNNKKKYRIVDGEHRYAAYRELGIDNNIPVITEYRKLNDSETKAQSIDNPLILKEGERPTGYKRLEQAIKYVNKKNEEEIKKILTIEMGKNTIKEIKGVNELVSKLKGLLGLGALKAITQEIIKNNYMKGWDDAETDLNINITPDSNAIDYMSKYTYDNIKGMNDEIAEKLRSVMQRAFMDGTSLEQVKSEITKVFDVGNNRVTMIARTESNRAANFGRLHGYQKSGMPGTKVYSAHIDTRTSPICKRLNKQEVGLNEDFTDPKGEWTGPVPPAHVNCRSSWLFKPSDEKND